MVARPHWWNRRAGTPTGANESRSLTLAAAERDLLHGMPREDIRMFRAAIAFFIIALIAAIFGYGGVAEGAADIGKVLFVGFLVIAVLALVVGMVRRPRP
jgi:uncharacterized membrane protein YtjA (UPF0391 family)